MTARAISPARASRSTQRLSAASRAAAWALSPRSRSGWLADASLISHRDRPADVSGNYEDERPPDRDVVADSASRQREAPCRRAGRPAAPPSSLAQVAVSPVLISPWPPARREVPVGQNRPGRPDPCRGQRRGRRRLRHPKAAPSPGPGLRGSPGCREAPPLLHRRPGRRLRGPRGLGSGGWHWHQGRTILSRGSGPGSTASTSASLNSQSAAPVKPHRADQLTSRTLGSKVCSRAWTPGGALAGEVRAACASARSVSTPTLS
jgi:hypothetical protein